MPFLIQTYGMISVSAQDSTLFIQDEQTERMNIEQQVGNQNHYQTIRWHIANQFIVWSNSIVISCNT